MESVGNKLKKIRLEKGISLEEAHKKTRIHLNILKAIEEDSLINFNPVYIKGFLKIYCKFLGVNPAEYIADYKEPKSVVKTVSEEKRASKEKSAALIRQPKAIKIDFSKVLNSKIIRKIFIGLVIVLASLILLKLGKVIFSKSVSGLKKVKAASRVSLVKKAKSTEEQKTQKSQQITAQQAVQVKEPESKPVPVTSGIRFSMRAKENCWAQIKIDGKTVFQNVLIRGRTETWQAKEKIELSLGNAGAIELEVNGKFISNLGKRGQALKNIVITKDGLSIAR